MATETETRLSVTGAGELILELEGITSCSAGIGVACSWGDHGEAGGVMDVEHVEVLYGLLSVWLERFRDQSRNKRARVVNRAARGLGK